jgi:hypothetical protein
MLYGPRSYLAMLCGVICYSNILGDIDYPFLSLIGIRIDNDEIILVSQIPSRKKLIITNAYLIT